MSLFRAVAHIDAPPERVWDLLRDFEGSSSWMVDATTVDVLTPHSEGVGVRLRAVTKIAGVPLADEMEVTVWQPERLIQVRHHRKPIIGLAWFSMAPSGTGTRFEWGEELTPPLGWLGRAGGFVLRRPIERVLARSVAKLKSLAETG